MPSKEPQPESRTSTPDAAASLNRVERFLRLVTWQMFFLLVILLYLAIRPQAGRYQFIVGRDEVMVFDTAWAQVVQVKLQKREVTPGEKPESGAPPAASENKE